MFFIDDLLMSPVKGLAAIARHIRDSAEHDLEDQEQAVVAELTELHRLLESCQISDEDFNAREGSLLDQLEKIQELTSPWEDGPT